MCRHGKHDEYYKFGRVYWRLSAPGKEELLELALGVLESSSQVCMPAGTALAAFFKASSAPHYVKTKDQGGSGESGFGKKQRNMADT